MLVRHLYLRVEATFYPWLDASKGRKAQHWAMSDIDVITVRGLVKSYGRRLVVDGFDLEVAKGEVVGLIGANGAGKTTTVECIQGLRRPDGLRASARSRPDDRRRTGCVASSAASSNAPGCLTGCGSAKRCGCSVAEEAKSCWSSSDCSSGVARSSCP